MFYLPAATYFLDYTAILKISAWIARVTISISPICLTCKPVRAPSKNPDFAQLPAAALGSEHEAAFIQAALAFEGVDSVS